MEVFQFVKDLKDTRLSGGVQIEELIVVFNHNVINLYFTTNKSSMYMSYYNKVHEFYDTVFTCLHNLSLHLNRHFFLIPLR